MFKICYTFAINVHYICIMHCTIYMSINQNVHNSGKTYRLQIQTVGLRIRIRAFIWLGSGFYWMDIFGSGQYPAGSATLIISSLPKDRASKKVLFPGPAFTPSPPPPLSVRTTSGGTFYRHS